MNTKNHLQQTKAALNGLTSRNNKQDSSPYREICPALNKKFVLQTMGTTAPFSMLFCLLYFCISHTKKLFLYIP